MTTETLTTKYTDIRQQWKAHAASKKITARDMAFYVLYSAVRRELGTDETMRLLKKAFVPITNSKKLDNGAYPYGALRSALGKYSAPSTILLWLTPAEIAKVENLRAEMWKGI